MGKLKGHVRTTEKVHDGSEKMNIFRTKNEIENFGVSEKSEWEIGSNFRVRSIL